MDAASCRVFKRLEAASTIYCRIEPVMQTRSSPRHFWDEPLETISRKDLSARQLRCLRWSVERAFRAPFYAGRLGEAGVSPATLRSLEDAIRIPFTVKDDLRKAHPFGMLAVPMEEVVRIHSSSGTTGRATAVYHAAGDLDRWSDLIARCLTMVGCTRRHVFQNMMSYGLFTGGLGLHYGAEKVGMAIIPAGAGNTKRQITMIQDFRVDMVHITPSYALHIISVLQEMEIDPKSLGLRIAIHGAEPYSDSTRAKLQDAYGFRAYDCYGLSEMNGPGVAFECPRQDGLHIWEDHYLVEVVDPHTGEPLPAGETGELVLTTLQREAMPLLRYRTGDLTSLIDEPCPCGRTHRRISRMKGRADDMMIVRGVNVFPRQVEEVLMRIPEVGTNYLIHLERKDGLDVMTVKVELSKGEPLEGGESLIALQKRIQDEMKREIQVTPIVKLLQQGTLPAVEGKARRVVDERQI